MTFQILSYPINDLAFAFLCSFFIAFCLCCLPLLGYWKKKPKCLQSKSIKKPFSCSEVKSFDASQKETLILVESPHLISPAKEENCTSSECFASCLLQVDDKQPLGENESGFHSCCPEEKNDDDDLSEEEKKLEIKEMKVENTTFASDCVISNDPSPPMKSGNSTVYWQKACKPHSQKGFSSCVSVAAAAAPTSLVCQGNFREYWKKLGLIDVDENTAPATFEIRSRNPNRFSCTSQFHHFKSNNDCNRRPNTNYHHHQKELMFEERTPTNVYTAPPPYHQTPKTQRYYSVFDCSFEGLGNSISQNFQCKLPSGWRTPSPDKMDPNFQQFKNEFISPMMKEEGKCAE